MKMSSLKLTDKVYSVGVLNPNARVADVIMNIKYGTSYNSYIVKGSEKNAIVETVHHNYFDEYMENIKSVIGDEKIDYIIINHTEPDHSGALRRIKQVYPEAQIFATSAGATYLKNIANEDLNVKVVKNGESISLGDLSFEFISAPFLHWPDTMFTYCKEEKVAFTCDFLGAHFCEPRMLSNLIGYQEAYDYSFEYYYRCIFGPFKSFVQQGLAKLQPLQIDVICNSHGPILMGKDIEIAIEKYNKWSLPVEKSKKEVAVVYATAYGCTKAVAMDIQKGIQDELGDKVDISMYEINVNSPEEIADKLNSCDGFLLGSPTINREAVPQIWDLISRLDAINTKSKTVSAFGSYGWSGEAVANILERLKALKCKVFQEGLRVCFVPSEEELKSAYEFGREFAKQL
jgi:flavorubredoxin